MQFRVKGKSRMRTGKYSHNGQKKLKQAGKVQCKNLIWKQIDNQRDAGALVKNAVAIKTYRQ